MGIPTTGTPASSNIYCPRLMNQKMLIKASFTRALKVSPLLKIQTIGSQRSIQGFMNDTQGEFWQFYADELQPDTEYELTIQDTNGNSSVNHGL